MAEPQFAALAGISNEALLKATGWGWKDWVTTLDGKDAKLLSHREIAQLAATDFEAGSWWGQMVAVGYERIQGLRVKNQKADGFALSASRVVTVPLASLYAEFSEPDRLKQWLGETLRIRTANENKSMRFDGPQGEGVVAVNFYPKSASKTQVTLEHSRLQNAERVEDRRAHWFAALDRLKK